MKYYNVLTGPLTGKNKEFLTPKFKEENLDILYSYWYLKNLSDEKILECFNLTKGDIFIDSGAFTVWAKKEKGENVEIDVDEYIKWLNKWDNYITLMGQIDQVIPSNADKDEINQFSKETWENYLYMSNHLKHPEKLLYTFHADENYKWLEQALEYRDKKGNPINYIALGGLVGKGKNRRNYFLTHCFYAIQNSSNPNVKVHGFGVSDYILWKKFPFESCDSSSPNKTVNCISEITNQERTELWFEKMKDYDNKAKEIVKATRKIKFYLF